MHKRSLTAREHSLLDGRVRGRTQCSDSVTQFRAFNMPRLPAMSSSGAPLRGSTDHLHAKNSSSFCACKATVPRYQKDAVLPCF